VKPTATPSTAGAASRGLLYLITGSEAESGDILRRIRPEAGSHQGIVRYFEDLLGSRLTAVSERIRADRVERMRRKLDLTEDALLEELPAADGE
jgi:hypothetical protein